MTSTLERNAVSGSVSNNAREKVRLPVAARSRKPFRAVVSAIVVVASIAVFASAYSSANHESPVLIVTSTIEQGQRITAADLGQASVSISGGVTPIPVADAPRLSGKRAAVTVPAGSLLTVADVTGSQPIADGNAVVGMALKAGQFPAAGVEPGDQVMIVLTASPGTPVVDTSTDAGAGDQSAAGQSSSTDAASGILVPQATVFDVEVPGPNSSGGTSELVSVEVSSTLAASVSTAAAADQVSLVLLPSAAGSQSTTSSSSPASSGH